MQGPPGGPRSRMAHAIPPTPNPSILERAGSQHAVYLLQSEKSGVTYTGSTSSLARRLHEHQTGSIRGAYTVGRGPWRLVAAVWGFPDAAAARAFERKVKKRSGGADRKLRAMQTLARGEPGARLAFELAEASRAADD
eukprot:tig00020553_g10516.t1